MAITTFDEYQAKTIETAIYPDRGDNLVYPALKLGGEAGEVAEKIGKLMRDDGYEAAIGYFKESLDPSSDAIWKADLVKELGDVLWYVAALAVELGSSLAEVAQVNIDKLESRAQRGVLGGSGDNR